MPLGGDERLLLTEHAILLHNKTKLSLDLIDLTALVSEMIGDRLEEGNEEEGEHRRALYPNSTTITILLNGT